MVVMVKAYLRRKTAFDLLDIDSLLVQRAAVDFFMPLDLKMSILLGRNEMIILRQYFTSILSM